MFTTIVSLISFGLLLVIAWNTTQTCSAIEILCHNQDLLKKAMESMVDEMRLLNDKVNKKD